MPLSRSVSSSASTSASRRPGRRVARWPRPAPRRSPGCPPPAAAPPAPSRVPRDQAARPRRYPGCHRPRRDRSSQSGQSSAHRFVPHFYQGLRWSAVPRSTKLGARQAALTGRMLPPGTDTVRAAPGSARRPRSAPDSRRPAPKTSPIGRCPALPASPAAVWPAREPRPAARADARVATVGTGRGVNATAAICANRSASTPSITSGSRLGEPVLERHRTRIAAQRVGLQLGENLRDVLERAVLQQPGEQQVAHLQQRQVLFVVDLPGRQQPGGFEIEQGRGDDQKRRGLLQVQLRADLRGCRR